MAHFVGLIKLYNMYEDRLRKVFRENYKLSQRHKSEEKLVFSEVHGKIRTAESMRRHEVFIADLESS